MFNRIRKYFRFFSVLFGDGTYPNKNGKSGQISTCVRLRVIGIPSFPPYNQAHSIYARSLPRSTIDYIRPMDPQLDPHSFSLDLFLVRLDFDFKRRALYKV